jgi:hypothetical protein
LLLLSLFSGNSQGGAFQDITQHVRESKLNFSNFSGLRPFHQTFYQLLGLAKAMACSCLCERSAELLDRTYSIAATNLARAEVLEYPSESFKALQPYPWSCQPSLLSFCLPTDAACACSAVPVYHATDRISKRALTKKHQLTAGTIKEVWAIVLNQSEREERIALRDSCKSLREFAPFSFLLVCPPLDASCAASITFRNTGICL